MTKPTPKFYVVWKGREPGIYRSWDDCRRQVAEFTGAQYKSFPTLEAARAAYSEDPRHHLTGGGKAPARPFSFDPASGGPIADSICTDAACSGNPGVLEYRGVDTASGAELFRRGPFPQGTVNIGEFLGVVHALAYLKQRDSDWPVYSDSRTAIAWVRKKAINTNLAVSPKNQALFDLVDRALAWLKNNHWPNPVLKWDTERWGEIPADFGRK